MEEQSVKGREAEKDHSENEDVAKIGDATPPFGSLNNIKSSGLVAFKTKELIIKNDNIQNNDHESMLPQIN